MSTTERGKEGGKKKTQMCILQKIDDLVLCGQGRLPDLASWLGRKTVNIGQGPNNIAEQMLLPLTGDYNCYLQCSDTEPFPASNPLADDPGLSINPLAEVAADAHRMHSTTSLHNPARL
jgi:hypothetical protein